MIARMGRPRDEVHVFLAELAVLQPGFDRDGPRQSLGDSESAVNDACRAGGNLVIVERDKNVLRIPPRDVIPIAIEHEDVEEVRPLIDLAMVIDRADVADHAVSRAGGYFQPDLVRVGRPFRERMAQLQRPHDRFEQIRLAHRQLGRSRGQGRGKFAVDRAFVFQAEEIDAHRPFQEFLLGLNRRFVVLQSGHAGIGRRE